MTLVESTKKKGHFLDLAAAELGLMKAGEGGGRARRDPGPGPACASRPDL